MTSNHPSFEASIEAVADKAAMVKAIEWKEIWSKKKIGAAFSEVFKIAITKATAIGGLSQEHEGKCPCISQKRWRKDSANAMYIPIC